MDFDGTKVQIVPNLCSYGSKSWNFEVFMYKYRFYAKNPKNSISFCHGKGNGV